MDHFLPGAHSVDFDDIANQLQAEGALQSPSYVHGGICGIYGGAGAVGAEDCLAAAAQALELGLHGELADTCLSLAGLTRQAMEDEAFEFHLLLPDDDTDMQLRVQALAEWCQGFMAAYALMVADTGGEGLGEETGEILRDIAAIADAGHDPDAGEDADSDDEEAEGHFFELTEYLRFACLNLFMNRVMEDAADAEAPQ